MPEIIASIIEALLKAEPKMLETGFKLILGVRDGMKNAIPNAVSQAGEVVSKVGEKLKSGFSVLIDNAKQWGRDLLNGFANGINERLGALQESVINAVNTITSYLHFSKPDVGPLRNYESWMPDMIEGMAKSLDRAMPTLLGKVSALSQAMNMSPTLNGNVNSVAPNVNVIVNSRYEQDPLGQMVSTIKTYSGGSKNDYNYGYGG